MLLLNNIDGFAIRTARLERTAHWQQFEVQIRQCIARHSPPHQPHEVSMLALEQEFRAICSSFFPKRRQRVPHAPHIPSMAARMWNARKQALAVRGRSIRDLFECWVYITTFRTIHKAIRKQSRQNKRDKLQRSSLRVLISLFMDAFLTGTGRSGSSVRNRDRNEFSSLILMACL